MREAGKIVADTHELLKSAIIPGVSTLELDTIAEENIRKYNAVPSFKGYGGFKGSICASINNEVVHGIPGNYELRDGDIVSIDCGTVLNGYVGDSAYTFCCGEVSEEVKMLLKRTKESLYKGIEAAVAGNRIGDIGYAVQSYVEQFGYGVVRELVGHGVGRKMHEDPQVPNYGRKGTGVRLSEGMVLAIEPMITLGRKEIVQERDGWTISTRDGKPAAHFEHDIAVRNGKAEILSSFEWAEQLETNI